MKKFFLFIFFVFAFVACADKEAEEEEKRLNEATENSYGDLGNITIIETHSTPIEYMSEKEGYEKFSKYNLNYNVKGQQYDKMNPYSTLSVNTYKKDGKFAYFEFRKNNDGRFDDTYQFCSVEVSENRMISTECGNIEESEVVNKILNAINHMGYFDY